MPGWSGTTFVRQASQRSFPFHEAPEIMSDVASWANTIVILGEGCREIGYSSPLAS
jgi:hypothetical protein